MQILARTGHPDFLDLPWTEPLEEWEHERLVQVVRGISRHVVRFVEYDGAVYALKELPAPLARHEYGLLRRLGAEGMPVVDGVGVVSGRGPDLEAVLITRHLDYSLPYRALFGTRGLTDLRAKLLGSLAELLVRIHLAGFFWGDCSLSNTLFRRDAGALSAYLVDAETGELHPSLTDGQRGHDLMLAEENIAGELMDVEAWRGLPEGIDPFEIAAGVVEAYESLWSELTREESFGPDEKHRIEERLRRLNELGFDVEEIELVRDGDALPAAPRPARGRARPPPPAAPPSDGAERAGEPGAPPAQRPHPLPRVGRGGGRADAADHGRRLPMALGGVRAGGGGGARGALGQAGGGRGLPRDPRAPLVPVGAGGEGRGDPRSGRGRTSRTSCGTRPTSGS